MSIPDAVVKSALYEINEQTARIWHRRLRATMPFVYHQWMDALVDAFRARDDSYPTRWNAWDHPDCTQVWDAGLCGYMDAVEAFLGGEELANEGVATEVAPMQGLDIY